MPMFSRCMSLVAAGVIGLMATTAVMAATDVEDPAVMTCGMFVELTGTNAPKYVVYRAWLAGVLVTSGLRSGAVVPAIDADGEMAALTQVCREMPDRTLWEVLLLRVGK
jgi:hypothetical protein